MKGVGKVIYIRRKNVIVGINVSMQFQRKKGEEIDTLSILVEKVHARYGMVSYVHSHQGIPK